MDDAGTHTATDALDALVRDLERRGFVEDGLSKWGKAVRRTVLPGHEPQALAAASPLQRRLVACAHGTPSPGADLCASWVEQVFSRLGLGIVLGSAAQLRDWYCPQDDLRNLKVGMIVATARHPYSAAGRVHGHVGFYVGDSMVMDAVQQEVRHVPLELWLSAYGLMSEPRWGWLGSMGLD